MLVIALIPVLFIVIGVLLAELPTGRLQKYGMALVSAGLIALAIVYAGRSVTLGS